MVTKAEIKKLCPTAKDTLVSAIVDNWHEAEAAGIITPKRIRLFFANIATETGGLTSIVESLYYTSAQRIYDVFKGPAKNRRFKSVAECKPYVKNSKKLAIKVYGGRMGNKPAPSTDGWDYRGGGMMQTTGRDGYRSMGFENNPSALQTSPKTAFLTAVREWKKRGCNELADADRVTDCRKAINGGTNGLDHVKQYLAKAKTVWPDGKAVSTPKSPAQDAPVSKAITNPVMVREYQSILKGLGYTEVGNIDGDVGKQTRTAILAFRDDHDLPLVPIFDDEMVEAMKSAGPRHLSEARVLADPAQVIAQVPEVKANWLSKVVSAITAFFSGIVALVSGIFDQFEDAKSYIAPIQEYAADVPGYVWLGLVAIIAATIFLINRDGEQKGVHAFRTGERR